MSKIGLITIGVIIGGLLSLAAGWLIIGQDYTYQGVLIDPPAPAADFVLSDQNGNLFRLSEQRNQIVLLFFGYTYCPDICPVTLSDFQRVKNSLGKKAEQVRFIFITVDPERDTRERIQTYLANFDPEFIGLSGDQQALEEVWKDYGVYIEKQELNNAGGYLIDHSARTYLIDKHGNWRVNYPYGMDPNGMVLDIQHLLRER
jgi:protein SCO1/2